MTSVRHLRPDDFAQVVSKVDGWWGRPVRQLLPRYLFDHFHDTSFVVEESGEIVAVVIAFLSPAQSDTAYIHFVGVDPRYRGHGLARALYGRVDALALADGRSVVRAITSPDNAGSIDFHRRLGFTVEPVSSLQSGIPTHMDYGPNGEPRVLMLKRLDPEPGASGNQAE